MNWEAFFALHQSLPREGPGAPDDVHWVLDQIPQPERILDAGCGPGADTLTFADRLPKATITAMDMHAGFVSQTSAASAQYGARVKAIQGDAFDVDGPFDLIWSAGAVYFAGIRDALQAWRAALAPEGYVAFSEPLNPGSNAPRAAHDFWQQYPQITDRQGITDRIEAAGFEVVGSRLIRGMPWAAYFDPLQARINALHAQNPSPDVREVLDAEQREIDLWRAAPDDIAYILMLVRPDA